ncbi:MAG TPA: DUF6249 domain-containing protein [Anaerolineales bacterium]
MFSSTDGSIFFFPFCCGLLFFLILFAFLVAWRYLQYRETLALAEKGLLKMEGGRVEVRSDGKGALRWGVVIAALGLALTIGLWPLGIGSTYPLGLGPWMIGAFIPLFFGLGLILIYVLTKDQKSSGNGKDVGGSA